MTYRIITGDALETLKAMEPDSVDCVVTSPPYWGLRQYLFDGAVTLRRDLSAEERQRVISELEALGVTPRL